MKKLSLSIAAVLSIAGATAAFAAELPSYETTGFPISPVQVGVVGAANVQERSPVAISTVTPLQWIATARAAANGTDRSIR